MITSTVTTMTVISLRWMSNLNSESGACPRSAPEGGAGAPGDSPSVASVACATYQTAMCVGGAYAVSPAPLPSHRVACAR